MLHDTFNSLNILIAEDELDILVLYKRALEKNNHRVTITNNGEDCLKYYHEEVQRLLSSSSNFIVGRVTPFDAMILDYKMPRINGIEVAREILAVNPHQRIIFASAYIKETLIDSINQLNQIVEIIQKPFEIKVLIDTIEDKHTYSELQKLNVDVDIIKAIKPNHEQIKDLLERLRSIHECKT